MAASEGDRDDGTRPCYCVCRVRHPHRDGVCGERVEAGMEVHVAVSRHVTALVPMCTPCVEACMGALDSPTEGISH